MTQALMDLGPRVDTKPTGKPGESRSPADSGAAFADAVDQAVDEACGRPDTVGRKDSRAHGGRSDHDSSEHGKERDSDRADTGSATVVWALTPHDLHAAHAAGRHRGAAAAGDRLAADAPTRSAQQAAGASGTHTGKHASHPGDPAQAAGSAGETTRTLPTSTGKPGSAAQASATAAAATSTTAASAAATHSAATPLAAPRTPASGTAADRADGVGAAAQSAPRAGTDRQTPLPGAASESQAPAAGSATSGIGASPHGGAATTTVHPEPGTGALRQTPPAPAHLDAAAPTGPDGEPRDHRAGRTTANGAQPGAAGGAASYSAAATTTGAATNAATNAATIAAASQVSPTAIHVPTAVAAASGGTPVAAATPTPMPFIQAQPDIANILAQLRGQTDGTYQLRAQVHPAELGAVAITATVHHGALTVLLSPDQTAQQAISQSLPQLRQHLADQGFTGVNVGLGSPSQSGQHGQGGGDHGARAQGSDHSVLHGPDSAAPAVDHTSARRTAGTPSALDLML